VFEDDVDVVVIGEFADVGFETLLFFGVLGLFVFLEVVVFGVLVDDELGIY